MYRLIAEKTVWLRNSSKGITTRARLFRFCEAAMTDTTPSPKRPFRSWWFVDVLRLPDGRLDRQSLTVAIFCLVLALPIALILFLLRGNYFGP